MKPLEQILVMLNFEPDAEVQLNFQPGYWAKFADADRVAHSTLR